MKFFFLFILLSCSKIETPEFEVEITLSMSINNIFSSQKAAFVKSVIIVKIDKKNFFIKKLYLN